MMVFTVVNSKGFAAGNHINGPVDTTVHPQRVCVALRCTKPPVIDGKLNDSCWLTGKWQADYIQYIPAYSGAPSRKTELKVRYDDKHIYAAIRAYDNMKEMTQRLGRRDNFSGDIAGVQFDSYFDHRTAFEFDLTSAGQKIDCWVSNDGWDLNWDALWYGKVAYEDSCWTAEFDIPLSQLRYGSAPVQIWGFNSWRYIDRLKEEDHWSRIANDGTGQVYTFGELHGLNGLTRNKRIEIAPYVSGKLTTDKKIPGNPFAKGAAFNGQAGVDAKIGITNNFTLDATINPDFGQVEADPSVMNLTAFETYFEEKRPFFTEGKNIFDFTFDADQLFYSRRIGHAPSYIPLFDTIRVPEYSTIGGAFKFSGKTTNGLSLGIIESVTPNEMADIQENDHRFKQVAEPLSNYFISRFQQDYDKGNTIIGGIFTYTHRVIKNDYLDFLSRNAFTYGIDITRYWKEREYFFEVKAIGSNIHGDNAAITRLEMSSARYFQRPEMNTAYFDTSKTVLTGTGASLQAGKWSKGHWRYNEEFIFRSPGLELNDLGYMNISDIIKNNSNLSYVEKKNTRVFKTYTITLLQQNAWDARGNGLYSLLALTTQAGFMNNWVAQVSSQYKFNTTDDWLLRGGPSMKVPALFSYTWLLQTNNSKKVYTNLNGSYNKGQSGSLTYLNIAAELGVRPRPNLLLSLQPVYTHNRDALQYIGHFDLPGASRFLLGKVDNRNIGVSFRVDLALTPMFTIQYYGSPFVSIGKYTAFKEVQLPHDEEYSRRFTLLNPQVNGDQYHFDDNQDGVTDYSISNPDFDYQQFRSNLVVRWEFKVGSALYLVWSQERTAMQQPGLFDLSKGFNHLFDLFPRNVLMIKFNYLFKN
jgi:hypothetical protein